MKINRQFNFQILGWLILMGVIAIVYVYYFLAYIPQQETKLYNRGFRILNDYCKNLDGKNEYYINRIKNFGEHYYFKYLIESSEFNLKDRLQNDRSIPKNKIDEFFELALDQANDPSIQFVSYERHNKDYPEKKAKPDLVPFQYNFELPIDENSEDPIVNYIYTKLCGSGLKYNFLTYRVLQSEYMKGLRYDRLFDNIFLLKGDSVINTSSMQVTNEKVIFRENENKNLNIIVADNSDSTLDNEKALLFGEKKLHFQGGSINEITLNGVIKKALAIPFISGGKEFFVVGTIHEDIFKQKTRSVSKQLLILLLGIILLVITSFPILKILLINERERLSITDSNFSILSLLFGISVLVLILNHSTVHSLNEDHRLNEALYKTADKHVANIKADLDTVFSFFTNLTGLEDNSKDPLVMYGKKQISEGEQYIKISDSLKAQSFPVNEILLIDRNGKVRMSDSTYVDLNTRDYFLRAKDTNKCWNYRYRENMNIYFYLQSIRSYRLGLPEAAISFPLNMNSNISDENAESIVMALTPPMPSLFNQVLPPNFSFMVMDRSGMVLFHSLSEKNLHENFLEEIENDIEISTAVDKRIRKYVKLNYNEKQWKALIQPLENTPLTHITLVDLNEYNHREAQVFLFTFYCVLAIIIILVLTLVIAHLPAIRAQETGHKQNIFEWLRFNKNIGNTYKLLIEIFLFLVAIQLAGQYLINEPALALYHSVMVVIFSVFVGIVMLSTPNSLKTSYNKTFSSLIVLFILLMISIGYSYLNTSSWIIPVLYLSGSFIFGFLLVYFKIRWSSYFNKVIDEKRSLNYYFAFTILWISIIAILPTLLFYKTIHNKEEILIARSNLEKMARQNLELKKKLPHYRYDSLPRWYENAQGNGILDYSVSLSVESPGDENDHYLLKSDSLYAKLKTPLKSDFDLTAFLHKYSIHKERIFVQSTDKKQSVRYAEPASKQMVVVSKKAERHKRKFSEPMPLVIFIVLLIAALFWKFYVYFAKNILNTAFVGWLLPIKNSWDKIIKSGKNILLVSFNPDFYIKDLKAIEVSLDDIYNNKVEKVYQANEIIVVKGIEYWLPQISKQVKLFENLIKLQKSLHQSSKLIVCVPFHFSFVKEYIKNKIGEDQDNGISIQALKKYWIILFNGYYKFIGGYLDFKDSDYLLNQTMEQGQFVSSYTQEQILARQHLLEPSYSYIWNHLTEMEKLILFDLAEDGIMNIKNKLLINRLISIGLIKLENNPEIFDPGFKHFILSPNRREETKRIEEDARSKGNWSNMRIFIVVIMVAILAFIFTTQSNSIDKILGIFTGSIAAIAALLKVFSSGSSVASATD